METNFNLVKIENDVFALDETCTAPALRYTTTTDDVKLFNVLNGGSEPVSDYIDTDVEVSDIIIASAEVAADPNDDESETVSKPCAHFITTNGKHLATLSNGVIKACKNLLSVGFAPTPETPITIHFKTIKTKRGTAHTFDLVKR